MQNNFSDNIIQGGKSKQQQVRTVVTSVAGTPANQNFSSLGKQLHSITTGKGQKHASIFPHQGSHTQKNSVSRDPQVVKAAAFPDVDRHHAASLGKSSSRVALTLSGKAQKNSGSKAQQSKRQNNTPLGYNSVPQVVMSNNQAYAGPAMTTPSASQQDCNANKTMKLKTASSSALHMPTSKNGQGCVTVLGGHQGQPAQHQNNQARLVKRIVKKGTIGSKHHLSNAASPLHNRSPLKFSSTQKSPLHSQKGTVSANFNNLNVRISQILKNSQKSPATSERDVVKFYDHLENLLEVQLSQKGSCELVHHEQNQNQLFPSSSLQGSKSVKIDEAVLKAISSQKSIARGNKSRTSKKSFNQQVSMSRSNKSQATKDQFLSSGSHHGKSKQKPSRKGVESREEVRSRNGLEDSGPIDLRIAQRHVIVGDNKANEMITPDLIMPSSSSQMEQHHLNQYSDLKQLSGKELQFIRHSQSRSQCKNIPDLQQQQQPVNAKKMSNLKKSFSIAFLKAQNSLTPGVSSAVNGYNEYCSVSRDQQKIQGVYYSHDSKNEYTRNGAMTKRSDSSNSGGSSLGDVSVNSIKQQAIKNHSHYGALKNLAKTNAKPSLFTRNNSLAQTAAKKMTSFDENVHVNQIRETGHVNQKFSKQQTPEVSNRFSARKNYGSVCIQPQSVKNKPLFFSVVDQNEKSEVGATDARMTSIEDNRRQEGKMTQMSHRHALSSASSPKFTPINASQLPLKSPFLYKETSRKQFSMKDKGAGKTKRKSVQHSQSNLSSEVKQMSQTSIRQTKLLWPENYVGVPAESTRKVKKSQQMSSSGRAQNDSGTGSRTTKQTPFVHRNSNPVLPTSTNPHASQSSKEGGEKTKRHKFSKSREFYGSGVINQMNLNSSITQKGSQFKQDNVLSVKRKSHGHIQTRVINSGTMKRRSSGTNIGLPACDLPHNQTQPLDPKKLRKIAASISPPPRVSGRDSQEFKEVPSGNFVDKIVDLLEKRNLITTNTHNSSNKPKVNKILQSLLAAHLKQVESTKNQQQHSQTERTSTNQRDLDSQKDINTPRVELVKPCPAEKSSCASTVYLGTAPQSQEIFQPIYQGQPSASQSKLPTAAPSTVTSIASNTKVRRADKCKRTPGFKYPSQQTPEKESAYLAAGESSIGDAANKGEMTSPGELYYVATNNKASVGGASSNQQVQGSQKKIARTPEQSDPAVYNFTNSGQKGNQKAGSDLKTKLPEANPQRRLLSQKNSVASMSNNSQRSGSEQEFSGKNKAYYARAGGDGGSGSKQTSAEDIKRVEGKNAYYTNRNNSEKQGHENGQLNKESTRFSSNERSQQMPELSQTEQRQQATSSRGSSQQKQAQKEYAESGAKSRRSTSQSRSGLLLKVSKSQGRIVAESSPPPKEKKEKEQMSPYGRESPRKPAACKEEVNSESEKDDDESLILSIRKHYMSSKKRNIPYPTSLRCYIIQQIVGKGAFGKVALAIHRLTQKPVAIKIIDKTTLQPGQIDKVRSEVALMSAIRHKHIIRLLEVFESNKHMYMVFEYASGGDLLQLVKKKRCLTEKESKQIFKQVVYGIAHCHCRSVLHRDIKLDNILLDEHGNVKVCDFGISRPLDNLAEPILEQCGTPAYIAPEILYEDGYKGFKSDIWGLGVLLYAMVTGTVPFRAQNMRELKYVIASGQFSFPAFNPRDQTRYSDDIKDFIRSMLLVDTKRRISIPEILAHPWLSDLQDRQSMQQGLNYQQLLSINALQPFGLNQSPAESLVQGTESLKINQIRVENLFIGHGSDSDSADSSLNARVDALTLTQTQLNEITIDHATVYINEQAIQMLEQYGFPKKLARTQIQNNVLSHATASYNLLVL